MRELREESGLDAVPARCLPSARLGRPGQIWHFVAMRAAGYPDRWAHHCADDGGHVFCFFWQPLARTPGRSWHPVHRAAVGHLRRALRRRLPAPGDRT